MKNLLAHVDEQSKKIEAAKSQAVGTRNMMSAEVETRTELLRDQRNIISDKQEHLEVMSSFKMYIPTEELFKLSYHIKSQMLIVVRDAFDQIPSCASHPP